MLSGVWVTVFCPVTDHNKELLLAELNPGKVWEIVP